MQETEEYIENDESNKNADQGDSNNENKLVNLVDIVLCAHHSGASSSVDTPVKILSVAISPGIYSSSAAMYRRKQKNAVRKYIGPFKAVSMSGGRYSLELLPKIVSQEATERVEEQKEKAWQPLNKIVLERENRGGISKPFERISRLFPFDAFNKKPS